MNERNWVCGQVSAACHTAWDLKQHPKLPHAWPMPCLHPKVGQTQNPLGVVHGRAGSAPKLSSQGGLYLLLNFSGCFSRMMWKRWAMEASCGENRHISGTAEKENPHPTRTGVLISSCLPLVPVMTLMMTLVVQGDGGILSQPLPKTC